MNEQTSRSTVSLAESAMPELPRGWVWTSVGEVISFEYGKGLTADKREQKGNIPVYGSNGIVGYHSQTLIEKPCLIIGRKGAAGYVHLSKVPCWPIDTTYYIIPPDELNLVFLYYLLSTLNLNSLDKSTAIPGLNRNDAYALKIPLPPLLEQGRIVTKTEELFTRLDAGVSALKKTQVQLKRYRQSVLKAACGGKLVPTEAELAKTKGRAYEPADALQIRILKERGSAQEKNSKDKKYKESVAQDISCLPEVSKGWLWTRVGEITEKIEKVSPEDEPEAEFIYMDISSIDNQHLKITEPKKYLGKDAPSRAKQKVKAGDVLFSTVRTYLKNIAQVPGIYNGQIASTGFSVLRPSKGMNEKFLFYYVQTEQFLNPLTDIQRGTSYPAVRDSDVREQFFPLPPLAEQHRIVAEVERHLSVADEVARTVEQSLRQAEMLRQSILKRAFEGKLVAQSPDDEPAGILLEHIKQEKSKLGNKKIIKIAYIKRGKRWTERKRRQLKGKLKGYMTY